MSDSDYSSDDSAEPTRMSMHALGGRGYRILPGRQWNGVLDFDYTYDHQRDDLGRIDDPRLPNNDSNKLALENFIFGSIEADLSYLVAMRDILPEDVNEKVEFLEEKVGRVRTYVKMLRQALFLNQMHWRTDESSRIAGSPVQSYCMIGDLPPIIPTCVGQDSQEGQCYTGGSCYRGFRVVHDELPVLPTNEIETRLTGATHGIFPATLLEHGHELLPCPVCFRLGDAGRPCSAHPKCTRLVAKYGQEIPGEDPNEYSIFEHHHFIYED